MVACSAARVKYLLHTFHENVELAEVHVVSSRKLYNDVSERR